MSDVKVMRLRYAGVCSCGTELAPGERAAYDRTARRVLCLSCHADAHADAHTDAAPADGTRDAGPQVDEVVEAPTLDVGVAGAAAIREYERRKAKDDAARAERSRVLEGDELVLLDPTASTEHPRMEGGCCRRGTSRAGTDGAGRMRPRLRAPRSSGARQALQHRPLFVGAAGVYVIDAKRYKNADVSVERTGGLFGPVVETLKVGGRRRTDLVDAVQGSATWSVGFWPRPSTLTSRSARCCVSSTPPSLSGRRTVGWKGCPPVWPEGDVSHPGRRRKVHSTNELRFAIAMRLSDCIALHDLTASLRRSGVCSAGAP